MYDVWDMVSLQWQLAEAKRSAEEIRRIGWWVGVKRSDHITVGFR